MTSALWLFDADCVLCSSAVQFVLRHELSPDVQFLALQTKKGRALAIQHGLDPDDPASFLLLEGDEAFEASDGVLALLRHLKGWPRLFLILHYVPRHLRDGVYYFVARHRYRMFGKRAGCVVPYGAQRERFVLEP